MVKEWGDPQRYYAVKEDTKQKRPDEESTGIAEYWEKLVAQIDADAKTTVVRTFRTWNGVIRESLRNETALRLTHGESQVSVPVRVCDGLPKPLIAPLKNLRPFGSLLLHRVQIKAAIEGSAYVARDFDRVIDFLTNTQPNRDYDQLCSKLDAERTRDILQVLSTRMETLNLVRQITGIDQDVLGAYFFHKREIQLYWLPIAIFSMTLGIDTERLTVVVLAHELAHAYTQAGRDIDGLQWHTEKFAKTELGVVEGLAQFYTLCVCRRLSSRFPAALSAFDKLATMQSEVYTKHNEWIEGKANPSENIRYAMVHTRRNGSARYDEFISVMNGAAEPKPESGRDH